MLKITGYSDKYSAHPGEEVKFYINAENNDSCLLYTSPSPRDNR